MDVTITAAIAEAMREPGTRDAVLEALRRFTFKIGAMYR